tara:strand:+ start:467 stop:1978 length:1512 start_codon:yes stop_codon:yes gene_type:complete
MSELENSLKTIAKGTSIGFLGVLFSKVFGYIYRLIVARIGVEQYGLISIGMALYAILTTIAIMGMSNGILRFVSYYREKDEPGRIKGTIFSALKLVTPSGIIFAIILFVFSKQIAISLFHDPSLSLVLKVFAIAIPLSAIRDIFLSISKAYHKIQYEVYAKNILENLAKVVLTFIFLFLGLDLFGASLAYTISIFLSLVLAFYLIEKNVFSIFKKSIRPIYANKELLLFSFPLLFGGIINSLIGWTDTLMLGFFRTSSEVGIYNAALPTAQLLYVAPLSLTAIFIPVLTNLYAKEKKEDFKNLYKVTTKWIFLMNLVILSLFFLSGTSLLGVMFGKEYLTGNNVLLLLGTFMFLGYLSTNSNSVLVVLKKTKLILFNVAVGATFNIILNLYLIPSKGLIGAAIATGVSLVIMGILSFAETYHYTKTIPFNFSYVKILISILMAYFITSQSLKLMSNLPTIIILISTLFIMSISYISLLFLTESFEKEDLAILKEIKRKVLGYR